MQRRTIVGIIIAILVIAGIVWLVTRKKETTILPVLAVSAYNQTKNKPATDRPANPSDVIVYTLNAENQSDTVISGYIIQVDLSDIAAKASLLDASGASYDSATTSLVWTPLDIPAHSSIAKIFSVKVNSLPAGTTDSVLKVTFNNQLNIAISQPAVAGTSTGSNTNNVDYKAPKTGPSEDAVLYLALFTTIGVFVASRYKFRKI